jgi:hypothetical protein
MKHVELIWGDRGHVTVKFDDRPLTIWGEMLLEHSPDFMIYARAINAWDDGTPLGEDEKADLLDQVVEEAAKLGAKFEIQW